jgi:hypothetical protein
MRPGAAVESPTGPDALSQSPNGSLPCPSGLLRDRRLGCRSASDCDRTPPVLGFHASSCATAPVDGFLARETDSTFNCKIDPIRIPFANVTQGNITIKSA